MNGCCRNAPGNKGGETVVLCFRRANLDYSISNCAYIEGHVMPESAECARHMVTDVCEAGNRDRVSRILALVYSDVVEMLYPYTKGHTEPEVIDDNLWEPVEYTIVLHLPADFSRTTLRRLSKLIHEYMVYRVLHDWLTLTNPEVASHWYVKAEEVKDEIGMMRSMRSGTLRRPLSPW